jgi:hypothetical protein
MREGTPEGLAGISTGDPTCTIRPYAPPGVPPHQILSPRADGSEIQHSITAAENTKTPPLREMWRRNLGEDIILADTRIIAGQAIIPSPSTVASSSSPTPIPFLLNHSCYLNCYYGFVFEFIPLPLFHPQDYDDVLDCFNV